jgi:hypothetical protein
MSKLNISRLTNENEDGSPKITGITTFSSTAFLEAPKGTTAQRPTNPLPGAIRFNTDGGHLEYFTGEFWDEVVVANNSLDGGNRGLFGGGFVSSNVNTIDYVTISSTGNALDFGDISAANANIAACSSSTRGIFGGGNGPSNVLDYITISSTGNATDFGDLTVARRELCACSSSTRGIFGGGNSPLSNVLDYITVSSTGNAADFGDLTLSRFNFSACSSSTRGVFGGGVTPTANNTIDYVTISSTGNATDFGDLTEIRFAPGSCSSSTRGVFGGGGGSAPTYTATNTIDYITILTIGNAVDFGDLTQGRRNAASCSNGHGGL